MGRNITSSVTCNLSYVHIVLGAFAKPRTATVTFVMSVCRYACTNVTLHVLTCSGRNRIISLVRRPNTDSTPNKPVTLPRNQFLIRYAVTSLVHTVTIRCYDTR
jgi:hypothetical protein